MSYLHRFIVIIVVLFSLSSVAGVTFGAANILSGDIVSAAVPVTALAIAFFKDDVEGEKQWLRNIIANQVLTSAARIGFNETSWGTRPNGSEYGFPSGHVAVVASGAAFLQERYGWEYGIPAWCLTGYVAYVRVDNNYHRFRDVAVSGILAYGVGKLFVTPENATNLAPVIGPDFIGLRWGRSW